MRSLPPGDWLNLQLLFLPHRARRWGWKDWWPAPILKLGRSTVISLAYQWHIYHPRDSKDFRSCVQGTNLRHKPSIYFLSYHIVHWKNFISGVLHFSLYSMPCVFRMPFNSAKHPVLLLSVILCVSTECLLSSLSIGRMTMGTFLHPMIHGHYLQNDS